MSNKAVLSAPEMDELREFHAYAQAKTREARLAQLMVETCIRLAAARRGLDPEGRYAVSPKGELLSLPPEGQESKGEEQGSPDFLPLSPELSVPAGQEVAR